MRRILSPSFALLAGLVTLLAGCAGETPTSVPPVTPTPGPGACNVDITLSTSSPTAYPNTAVAIIATVKKNGVAVPDGASVTFTTDFGFFAETGFPTASKVIMSGVAEVTLASTALGPANVKATFECRTTPTTRVTFIEVPVEVPFISSISPIQGSCLGNDTVTINGGHFDFNGNTAATTRVTFGGAPATIVSVSATQIVVKTPARTLANPAVPESVDVIVTTGSGTAFPHSVTWSTAVNGGFTYFCQDQVMVLASLSPISGPSDGGTVVTILGQHFGTNLATTRVAFGGVAGSVTAVTDSAITVTSPRHPLTNPNVPETVDVTVTRDLGLPSQQVKTLVQAFTYRGTSSTCPAVPNTFIASIAPLKGTPNGGDVVTINGGGFATNGTATAATTRVEFGGLAAQVTNVTDTTITVTSPRRTLANPNTPETVDVIVTIDVGGPNCRSAKLANAFTYTNAGVLTIYSISPRTGPNDVSTRVTIFGTGFVFPLQVLLSTQGCGTGYIEAVITEPIQPDHIVFQTPIAANGNVCLANQLVSIRVLNPTTGDKADFADAFKYYACPTVTAIEPCCGPYTGGTTVRITGHNFVEPVVISGAGWVWQVVSVSESEIIAITGAAAPNGCADITGPVDVTSTFQSCGVATGPNGGAPPSFVYQVKLIAPVVTSWSPTSSLEAGGGTETVNGANFIGNLRVIVHLPSGDVTLLPTVISTNQLTFTVPPFSGAFKTQACTVGGVAGTRNVDTEVKFDVVNITSTCSATGSIIYIPSDKTCQVVHTVTSLFSIVPGAVGSLTDSFIDGSTASPGPITSWAWNFGDGTTFNGQNPPAHHFPGAGPYNVSLTVGDGTVTGSSTQSVTPP